MTVKNICPNETYKLNNFVYWFDYLGSHNHYQSELMKRGWRFYVVDQRRGFCISTTKTITMPKWVLSKQQGRIVQYLLHEIAHALDFERNGRMSGHKKPFMDILIEICPAELLVYEMSYKPKNLVAAGAKFCPDSLDF